MRALGITNSFHSIVYYEDFKMAGLSVRFVRNNSTVSLNDFTNLFKIGYRYFDKNRRTKKDTCLVEAFQRRFLPNKVTGKIDEKTFKISHFLAKQIKN